MVFQYGEKEMDYLRKQDKKMGEAIDAIGMIHREITPDLFAALVYSIVGQQISGKAADTVWSRLCNRVDRIKPENIHNLEIDEIQSCGMSRKKADYIKGIAEAAVTGEIDFLKLYDKTDMELIELLTKRKGIGVWSVEMLLIFSLGRPDVVSYGDFGIRKGMMKLYGLNELTKEQFHTFRKRYSPYGTTASLYLWEIAAGA